MHFAISLLSPSYDRYGGSCSKPANVQKQKYGTRTQANAAYQREIKRIYTANSVYNVTPAGKWASHNIHPYYFLVVKAFIVDAISRVTATIKTSEHGTDRNFPHIEVSRLFQVNETLGIHIRTAWQLLRNVLLATAAALQVTAITDDGPPVLINLTIPNEELVATFLTSDHYSAAVGTVCNLKLVNFGMPPFKRWRLCSCTWFCILILSLLPGIIRN